jgi:hypothetical protein
MRKDFLIYDILYKERSPNIKGNALHEENTSYNFVPDQGFHF